MERISVKHIKEIQGNHEECILINVLPEEEFLKEHIPGSINIPFSDREEFVQEVESIMPSKKHKVILYCSHSQCYTSENAAKELDTVGFSYVMDFAGGMQEWKEAGEPLEQGMGSKKLHFTD